ncbi:flagellar basal-body MS-ring/collar protein FliF [Xylophilus sp.]|uniref:flagellar basal-body MS-ring/collar protein FliF n=1 Tax=Xylophilus sp. TaxID=2653893 RepID=UPI0013BB5664|nr:flagellar basal-body MS-ring/collar protein FliF [Xylophilus sp.]KAF1047629.1 MAG: Flagellar M-ring protein [Xylophilus sp.]
MSAAVAAEAPAVIPPESAAGARAAVPWSQRLAQLAPGQKRWIGAGALLLAAAVLAAVLANRQPDYKVLFSNLSDKDGGAIVAQLSQMNVPYRYTEGGGAILVPADRVHDVRLRLATQGLPKGSVTGFEITEGNRFGVTQFQERLNFQRGLEGELTRSIQALSSVQTARVHLALPNQNGFFREQQKPSASVLLSLYPGRILDRAQIAGIVHLVASSVPEMDPSAVSVLDDSGKLLSTQAGDGGAADAEQLAYVQRIEQQYSRRILDLLEPVVGRNNVRAQVTADVDFSQTDLTSEQHKPNQTPDSGAVRSQQVSESSGQQTPAQPTGVPGATSNQPPVPATAPINGANPAPTAAGGQGGQTTSKRESVINYEVDKTTRVTRGASGAVRRLTAAVVVNYQPGTPDPKTGAARPEALKPEQIEQMTALVRETIGFSKERGDSVNLMNAPFQVEAPPAPELPLWRQPETLEFARTWAWPIAAALGVALVLIGTLRPALRAVARRRDAAEALAIARAQGAGPDGASLLPGGQLNALEGESLDRPGLEGPAGAPALPMSPEQARLEEARALARANPVAVAHIVQGWINGEGS